MEVGRIVKLKNQPVYGTMKVKEIHPSGYSGRKFISVDVFYSSNRNETDWTFGLVKTFKKSQLEVVK